MVRGERVSQAQARKVGWLFAVEETEIGLPPAQRESDREGGERKHNQTHLYTIAATPSYRNASPSADPKSPDATACSDFGEVLVR